MGGASTGVIEGEITNAQDLIPLAMRKGEGAEEDLSSEVAATEQEVQEKVSECCDDGPECSFCVEFVGSELASITSIAKTLEGYGVHYQKEQEGTDGAITFEITGSRGNIINAYRHLSQLAGHGGFQVFEPHIGKAAA